MRAHALRAIRLSSSMHAPGPGLCSLFLPSTCIQGHQARLLTRAALSSSESQCYRSVKDPGANKLSTSHDATSYSVTFNTSTL
eukprot:1143876-Pelagomonas_calceolata.AAC.2